MKSSCWTRGKCPSWIIQNQWSELEEQGEEMLVSEQAYALHVLHAKDTVQTKESVVLV